MKKKKTLDQKKLRVDAQANRDRILSVARDVLADDPKSRSTPFRKPLLSGQERSTDFPSREALVLGVYLKEIDALVVTCINKRYYRSAAVV
jgi:hypothetical protein